jgi:hypothetical protein
MNEQKKSNPLVFILAIICIALCFGLYTVFDRHEKKISQIAKADSLKYVQLERKIMLQDSVNTELRKLDRIQIENFVKLNVNIEKTKKSINALRDSMGIWPDL